MNITIINIHHKREITGNYIYIGRNPNQRFSHYGNPFTHLAHGTFNTIKVASREDAVQAYEDWLRDIAWPDVEPERRQWIRDRIKHLALAGNDLTLGCFCAPKECHGEALKRLILEHKEAYSLLGDA